VLGPLEIADGEKLLAVERGRQKTLLLVLLLHANEVVSTDRLIEALWEERPPASAGKLTQGFVSRLRRVLDPGASASVCVEVQNLLGLDLTTRFGASASFLSAGGYHHHLAANTWGGVGVPPQPADAAGLREWTLVVPDENEVNRADERLRAGGVKTERLKHGLWTRDPAGNALVVRTPPGTNT